MKVILNGREVDLSGPRGPSGPDGAPIGTIISFMGAEAPAGYLVCDGAEHPVAEHPELAAFFAEQFGSANYFGGDGETSFAVPDLRNMFLRGYHGEAEEQLSGELGEGQEATQHAYVASGTNNNIASPNANSFVKNADAVDGTSTMRIFNLSTTTDTPIGIYYTSRPVNMAVLYCIKAAGSPGGSPGGKDVYSAEEQRIGTWIGGKPLYRKVVRFDSPKIAGWGPGDENNVCDLRSLQIDEMVSMRGTLRITTPGSECVLPIAHTCLVDSQNAYLFYGMSTNHVGWIVMYVSDQVYMLDQPCTMVIEYTKTTDEAVST